MRYLVKCTKEDEIKFISHLDFLRTVQRIIRRAELPAEYSKGFNPHLTISFAQPLPVGAFSLGEYIDMPLTEELDEKEIKDRLNASAPRGVKILDVVKVESEDGKKIPPAMALVEASAYTISIPYRNTENAEKDLEKLLKEDQWNVIKKSKKGPKEINMRPMINKISFQIREEYLELDVLVSCGSSENLSPQLLADYIRKNTGDTDMERFVKIERKELYTYKNSKLVSLLQYFA